MIIWNKEADSTLRELWTQGLSASEIGRRMGATKNSIIGRAHRMALERRVSPVVPIIVSAESQEQIKRALLAGVPVGRVIRQTGVTRLSVERVRATMPFVPPRDIRNGAVKPKAFAHDPAPAIVAEQPPTPSEPPALWQPARVTVFVQPKRDQCEWVSGDGPFIRCEAVAVREEGMRPPYSYCAEHRRIAYTSRQEQAA